MCAILPLDESNFRLAVARSILRSCFSCFNASHGSFPCANMTACVRASESEMPIAAVDLGEDIRRLPGLQCLSNTPYTIERFVTGQFNFYVSSYQ